MGEGILNYNGGISKITLFLIENPKFNVSIKPYIINDNGKKLYINSDYKFSYNEKILFDVEIINESSGYDYSNLDLRIDLIKEIKDGGIIQENIMAETGMGMASDEASGIAGNQNMAQEMARSGSGPSEMEGSIRDVDYLKKSLEQIAASRERGRTVKQQEDWLKDLNPDELKLIGEILHEYLT